MTTPKSTKPKSAVDDAPNAPKPARFVVEQSGSISMKVNDPIDDKERRFAIVFAVHQVERTGVNAQGEPIYSIRHSVSFHRVPDQH